MRRTTPLQNRVTPSGEIVSHPARGLLMGNRGCLHGPDRRLGAARWRSKLWICCSLTWKGVRRDPMPPGRWTALFFLDEATALAAGHRPCAYCRRADFLAFAEAWRRTPWVPQPAADQPHARTRDDWLPGVTGPVPLGQECSSLPAGVGPGVSPPATTRYNIWCLAGFGTRLELQRQHSRALRGRRPPAYGSGG
jgi:hypothetical protein